MVNIDTLYKKGIIRKLGDFEESRYIDFFESSYKENLEHSEFILNKFPRWSIISGYYAMHDITKLLFAKNFKIKVEFNVHKTAIQLLKELIRNKELTKLINAGYKEFLNLANDLKEARKERTKAQYYTGKKFIKEEFEAKSKKFHDEIVVPYLNKIQELLKNDRVI